MSVLKRSIKGISKLIRSNNLIISKNVKRSYAKQQETFKVTVCGAAGYVGQPLSLMLKQSPLIDELAINDIAGVEGFGVELKQIDTKCKVSSYTGDYLKEALQGAKIVVVVAATTRTAFLAHSAMFEANAYLMYEIAQSFALTCPTALLVIATNPVNSLVPLASEVIKCNGVYNRNAIFGVTALDVVRANSFVAEVQGVDPHIVSVPVIGGNVNKTIIPVLSQATPSSDFTNQELENITKSVQNAHHDIIKAKNKESATLSSAFAIAKFVLSLVKGLRGHRNIVECAYVRSKAHPNAKYLATPLLIGTQGIEKNLGIPDLSEYENCQLENAIPLIKADVQRGERFMGVIDPPICDPCDPDPKAPPCPPNWCNQEDVCKVKSC